jgi:nicotinate-nucleotide adenylyltransferase
LSKSITYALFGGSFDPPHLGHKEIIKKALDYANKVIAMPTYLNPFKNSFNAPPQKRINWVKKSFNFKNVEICDYEIKQNRAVYTIESFKHLSKIKNIKFIIIGSDNLKDITKWKNFKELNNSVTWLVANREGFILNTSALKNFIILNLNINVSSTQIREGKKLNFLDEKIRDDVLNFYKILK